jgi:hypothetical protein
MQTKEQARISSQKYRNRHPEYTKNLSKQYQFRYKTDPEFKKSRLEYAKKYGKQHREKIRQRKQTEKYKLKIKRYNNMRREKVREFQLMSKYNMTLDDYNKFLEQQNGVCAICKEEEKTTDKWKSSFRRLRVDHSPKTGKVRGLLCHKCNVALGLFKDDSTLLLKAFNYLAQNGS